MNNRLKVIIPFYNPSHFLDKCINSILTQKYDNFEVIFIDDASTDGSDLKIQKEAIQKKALAIKSKASKIHSIINTTRLTALENLHKAIMDICTDKNDIVVILDGDDWLLSPNVLSFINDFYEKNEECWMMYGSSKWTDGRPCCSRPYSEKEFLNLRNADFKISHIRTFRAGLYHAIKEQDADFSCLKDNSGNFYTMTYDVAMFLPMLELSGYKHVFHNTNPLYSYNRSNPISDDKVDQSKQWNIHAEILKKPKFNLIENF